MKKLSTLLLVCAAAFSASMAYAVVKPLYRDLKPVTQAMIEKQTVTDPLLAVQNRLKSGQATSSATTTTVSSFTAQPDVCRGLSITPGGSTGDVPGGSVVVTGTNFHGSTITESIGLAANQNSTAHGNKAFCTVTSVVFPVQDGASAVYDIGINDKLGLKRCMDSVGHLVFATASGAYESTRPTCLADDNEVEGNSCDPNAALNGSADIEFFFLQNFRCLP